MKMKCALVAVLLACACATGPAPRPSTRLRVDGSVSDATLWVDDRMVGTLGEVMHRGAVPLPPGYHRVEVRHPSYYSLYRDVDQSDGGEVAWHVDLHPLLD